MTACLRTTLLFGLFTITGCSTGTSLEERLDDIGRELGNVFHVGIAGEYRYEFAFDRDFPCSVTLTEFNRYEGVHWQRAYRFELSDLLPGKLLVASDRRRAISYYSEKNDDSGSRTFPPKKINAIRLHGADSARLQPLIDAVIRECRERNSF